MGKGIYSTRPLAAGTVITWDDVCLKTPANGVPPYMLKEIIGKKVKKDMNEEMSISIENLE